MIESMPTLCKGNHTIKQIYFCKKCALDYPRLEPLERVFFCPSCSPQLLRAHNHQSDRFPITDALFTTLYNNFKAHVIKVNSTRFTKQIILANSQKELTPDEITNIMKTYLRTNPPLYINLLAAGTITIDQLQDYNFRKWLADVQFWKGSSCLGVDQAVQAYVVSQIAPAEPVNIWNNFQIDFKSSEAAGINLEEELNGASSRLNRLNEEKRMSQLFVEITSSLKNDEIEKILQECDQMKDKVSKEFSFLLKLGKLKALQLHDKSSYLMKKILAEINVNDLTDREKELYYYFSAISQWVYIEDRDDDNGYVFLDSRNKKYYKLNEPQKYISSLTKAIEISKKAIYLACRGVGYLVMTLKQPKLHQKAEKDFSEAEKLSYKSDSMQNNRILNKVKSNLSIIDEYFKQQIQVKKTEYLINMCKYLQSKKNYRQHRRYAQELIQREPSNVSFKVMLLTTLLKLKDTYAARNTLSEIKDARELQNDEIAQFQRKIQLLRAYEQEKVGNYEDAEGKFEHAAKFGRPSATYWFNYAAFLFKYRNELDKNQKALAAINRALEIKQTQNPEYYELKYMLLFMMGNLQQAKAVQHLVRAQKYKGMKEYIDNNL